METDYLAELEDKKKQEAQSESRRGLIVVVLITVTIIIVLSVYFATRKDETSETPLPTVSGSINASDIMIHIWQLSNISISNPAFHGSRSVLDGYNKSAEYVVDTLHKQTSFAVTTQPLVVPVWQQNTAPQLIQNTTEGPVSFINGLDFQTLRYGGDGIFDFWGKVVQIDNYGCSESDYERIIGEVDPICLIRDGTGGNASCDYGLKGFYAQSCAAGIIYRNSGTTTLSNARVRKVGWLEGDPLNHIPFLSATYTVYQLLIQHPEFPVRIVHNTTLTMAETYNVFAETKGDPTKTIVVGSHLDSVPEGPGLNDNGSGSSMNLQLAILFSKLVPSPVNRIRFAWWGAEEIGLLGSYWYVAKLSETERSSILCNLNFDMMASPNGMRQVHNGSLSPTGYGITPETIAKSNELTKLFAANFDRNGLPWISDGMGGGSDYFPFLVDNIPAGGLATGAGAIKSMSQRTTFGGLANAQMDPCYHVSCDTPENIDQNLLQQISAAAADVIQTLAMNPNPFPTFTQAQLDASVATLDPSLEREKSN